MTRLPGNPAAIYFRLGPIHARRLGLAPHPDLECALGLQEGADPDAIVELPNGVQFTARELTELAHKSGDPQRGWEIHSQDGGGYPSEEIVVS